MERKYLGGLISRNKVGGLNGIGALIEFKREGFIRMGGGYSNGGLLERIMVYYR